MTPPELEAMRLDLTRLTEATRRLSAAIRMMQHATAGEIEPEMGMKAGLALLDNVDSWLDASDDEVRKRLEQ